MSNTTSLPLVGSSFATKVKGRRPSLQGRGGKARRRKDRKGGDREEERDGDSRKTERAKDRTESGLKECHGPESSPCISTQYPLLSPKIIGRKQGKPQEGRGRHEHNQPTCRLACS